MVTSKSCCEYKKRNFFIIRTYIVEDQDLTKMAQERHFSPTQKIIKTHSSLKKTKAFGTFKRESLFIYLFCAKQQENIS